MMVYVLFIHERIIRKAEIELKEFLKGGKNNAPLFIIGAGGMGEMVFQPLFTIFLVPPELLQTFKYSIHYTLL